MPHADVEGEKLRDHIRDTQWSSASAYLSVHAENLVLSETSPAFSLEWSPGERVDIASDPWTSRLFSGALTGALPAYSGALHVLSHPLPSDAAFARLHVSLWNTIDDDALLPLGESLEQRMSCSSDPRHARRQDRARSIATVVARLNDLSRQLSPEITPALITPESLPGLLPRQQQILIFSALAVIDGASVCLVNPVEPVTSALDRALWWRGLEAFGGSNQTIGLFSLPNLENSPSDSPVNNRTELGIMAGLVGAV